MTHEIASRRGLGARPSLPVRIVRSAVHHLCYHLFLTRTRTTVTRAAGFRLLVRPTVFHPRLFVSSEFLANFVARLDLKGKSVADVGTGSGILALAAARAGASNVVAIDINPEAVGAARDNAIANGLGGQVTAVCSNLLSALSPELLFDVILSNPPYFPCEPRDLADRAWHGGPGYRDIEAMFEQARQRLAPDGRAYMVLSSIADLDHLYGLIERAGFRYLEVARRWIVIESLIIVELRTD